LETPRNQGAPQAPERARAFLRHLRKAVVTVELVRGPTGEVVDGVVREANAAALRALGRPIGEAVGNSMSHLLGDEAIRPFLRAARSVARTGEVQTLRTRRGGATLVESILPAGGDRVTVVSLEEGPRTPSQDEARRALELLELGDAFFEVDPGWRIQRLNRTSELLLGQGREAAVGRTLWEVWPWAARPDAPPGVELRRCMDERAPVRFEAHDAERDAWTSVSAHPTTGGGIAVFFRDVSDRRRAEAALQRANARLVEADRHKDEFLGILSHELRNPLAPIWNSIYILDHAEPGGEQARRAREVIARQAGHLGRLVDDLLDVTRIANGKVDLRRTRLELGELVRRTGEDHRALLEQHGVTLELALPDAPVWVDGDLTRLAQVVGNLLQNAAKFTATGGRVTLSLVTAGGEAEIRVRDTGTGIEPALLEQVFEPFTQGAQGLARTAGGLGLGLALVKGLAALHGGRVAARSDGPGQGTEFVVTLPVASAAGTGEAVSRLPRAAAGRRVLVVDDNPDAAESLAQLVELFGHRAEVAFDGPSAIQKIRAGAPDVVLCDIGLPGMSGYEVARAVRAEDGGAVRLVAVSGYAQPEDLRAAAEAGFDRHIAKPPSPDELARLLC
jgi:PAS domain S-box-containing protein